MTKNLRFYLLTLLCAVLGTAWGGTITFADLGLENSVQYNDPFDGGDFTVTFAGGENDGKYYTTGSGIRVYGNGTMTVAAKDGKSVTKIVVTYAGSNKPTTADVVDCGTYDAETGTWTGSSETVVFTRPSGSGHWRVQKLEVTVGEGGTVSKKNAGLAWSGDKATVTIGSSSNEFPTLANPNGLTVTYTSSDQAVATIAADGTVTLVAEGTTTIKAASAENETYKAGEATYTLTVMPEEQAADGVSGDIVFGDLELENGVQYSDPFKASNGLFTVTFAGGGNDGKYYTTGSGIRVYGDGTMTVAATKGVITKIVVTYDGTFKPTTADVVDGGTYNPETGTWTGEAASVTFTRPTGSGHWRVKALTVTVKDDGTVTPTKKEAGLAWSTTKAEVTLGAEDNTFPTLANPNGLTVTYTSSDEEVATIAADGTVTLVAAGTTTIKAASAENDTYKAGNATYTLTVKEAAVEKLDAELAWSASTAEVTLGADDNVFPTLSNPHDLAVTYSSSQEGVATIDETGAITLVKDGKSTIKASFAGDDTYNKADVTYQLIVSKKAEAGTDVYELVDDASTLAAGQEIIFVGNDTKDEVTTYYALSETQNSNNRAAEEVTLNADGTVTPNSNVQVITLEGEEDDWYFNVGGGYLYAASSKSNWLRTEETADANANATISIDGDGLATVLFQGSNTRNDLRFNYNNGAPLFSCYASTTKQPLAQIFRKVDSDVVKVTIGEAGYATLYYSNKNLKLADGMKAFTCKTNDEKQTIETQSYTSVVPAGSAVVLQAAAGTYELQVVEDAPAAAAGNMLLGTDTKTAPTAPGTGDYHFYKLAKGEKGLGFYAVEEGFVNGAHKAYLAVPASKAAASYAFDLTDGIRNIDAARQADGKAYTITGARIDASKLPAGIYIVNGKKVIVK